jgi:DNA helicase II / ATP-dependent DNA helicase PcrA
MLELFKNTSNGVLTQYQARFKFVMVDEYQDTNQAQYQWLQALAGSAQNLCCVGDDDQAIYGWRGADVAHILAFGKDYPAAQIVRLEQNYRSTPAILGAANSLIKHNESRLGKDLWTADTNIQKVKITEYEDGREEARSIADALENLQQQKLPLNGMAVLVRTAAQMRAFEERWNYIGLPYRVVGGPRFYERAEVRDAIAYLRLVVQPADDLAFERIINLPKRGVGPKAMDDLRALARARGTNLLDALQQSLIEPDVKPKLRETYRIFWQMYQNWQQALPNATPTQPAAQILDESGYVVMWQADADAEAKGRLENLKELLSGLAEFTTLAGFLEHVSLVMENFANPTQDCVTLMTLHAAKGLEFDYVFLPGWEEGLFPSARAQDDQGLNGTEEERRLAYVGITRARQTCYISYVQRRMMYGQFADALPSRFVNEIDEKFVQHTRLSPPPTQSYSTAPSVPRWLQQKTAVPAARSYVATQSLADTAFKVGQKVYNPKLGAGTVVAAEDDRTHVRFDVGGMRTIMNNFLFTQHADPENN